MDRLEGAKNRIAAREWFGLICFERILSTVHVARANNAVSPSAAELSCSRHQFYIERSFRDSGLRRRGVHGQDNIYLSAVGSTKKKSY